MLGPQDILDGVIEPGDRLPVRKTAVVMLAMMALTVAAGFCGIE